MNIEVWFFGRFRELAVRQRVAPLEHGAQLADLIHWLIEEYGVEVLQIKTSTPER